MIIHDLRARFVGASLMAIATFLAFQSASAAHGGQVDRPTDGSARVALQGAIKGPQADKLTIESFRKTDGLAQEERGAKLYTLEFAATLVFAEDMLVQHQAIGLAAQMAIREIVTAPMATTLNDGKEFSWDAWFNTAVGGQTPAFKGDKLIVVGHVAYVRFESGWRVRELSFKVTMDTGNRAPGHGPVKALPGRPTGDAANPAPPTRPANPSLGVAETLIQEATRGDQDSAGFQIYARLVTGTIDTLLPRVREILAKSGDPVVRQVRQQDMMLIETDLTRHGRMPFATADRYCAVLERVDEKTVKIHLKALLYFPPAGQSGRMMVRPANRIADQATRLLDQIAK